MDTELLERIDRGIAASDADLVADITRLVAIRSTEGEPLPGAPFGAGPRPSDARPPFGVGRLVRGSKGWGLSTRA